MYVYVDVRFVVCRFSREPLSGSNECSRTARDRTIALLIHYHIGIIGAARCSSDIGVSLLTRDASSSAHSSFSNINITGVSVLEQAKSDVDDESWLAQFMAKGRVMGAAARTSRGAGFTVN